LKTTKKTNDLIQILKKQDIESLSFIDVGAKDFLEHCPELAPMTILTGFEPNQDELNLLKNKYQNHTFKTLKLEAECLSDINGETDFYITKHASMSSLLPLDLENYQKHFGLYRQFGNWKDNVAVDKIITVKTLKLDDYIKTPDSTIDFIKIDTQGSELRILKGAENLLNEKRINVLKIEVSTIAVYQDQVMFSDVDIYLRSKGYVLIDFITYRNTYKPVFGKQHHRQHHYAPCGDAIYVLDSSFLNNENAIKSAVILLWQGYYSLGMYLLKNSAMPKNEQKIISEFRFTEPRSKIKQLLHNLCPPLFLHWIKKT